MELVATIVVDPAVRPLDDALLERARKVLDGGEPHPLEPGRAADVPVRRTGADPRALTRELRVALEGEAAADVIVQPAEGRRKRLLVSDMDSTLIGQECIDELADAVGVRTQVAEITARAMRGEVAFEPALKERVALLAGVPVSAVEEILAHRITLTAGARTLVATMRAAGARTALVSGGFTVFTDAIVRRLGMHEGTANRLVVADGAFTGEVEEPVLGEAAKRTRLEALVAGLGIRRDDVVAIGDGANDAAMVEVAGLGIAFRAKPALAAVADAEIRHTDLETALFFQGFPASAFVR